MGQLNLDFTMPGLSCEEGRAGPGRRRQRRTARHRRPMPRKMPSSQTARNAQGRSQEKSRAQSRREEREAAPKADEKKADGSDDVLAPPPGTTITKYPKVEPKKNGIRDLCLSLFGLREAKIKQVTVNCQTDKGQRAGGSTPSDSQDWPLVVRRPGTDISADLFLEPPPGDCHQKNFTIMVMYEDGQAGNATAIAQEHTDPKLAVDPEQAGGSAARRLALLDGRRKTLRQAREHRLRKRCGSRRPGKTISRCRSPVSSGFTSACSTARNPPSRSPSG